MVDEIFGYTPLIDVIKYTEDGLPLIIDFYTQTCVPCKALEPTFFELASKYKGKANFAKMDLSGLTQEEQGAFYKRFNFLSVPKFLIVEGGDVKQTFPEGKDISHNELKKTIEDYIQSI